MKLEEQGLRSHGVGAMALLVLGVALVSGCQRRELPPPESPVASAPLSGVRPSPDLTGASDHTGAPAIGALQASQPTGGAKVGGAPQSTGGDGAASAPPPPASR